MSKFFYHGIRNGFFAPNIVIDIFKTGDIKSKRLQNESYHLGFNGPDYISICRKGTNEDYEKGNNNAFYNYILNSFCFIINDEIDAIKGEFIPEVTEWGRFELVRFMNAHPERRITDMFDEWQVKDEINFSNIIGIGIPLLWIEKMKQEGWSEITDLTRQIIDFASNLGLDIVNSSIPNFIEQYEQSKLLITTSLNM